MKPRYLILSGLLILFLVAGLLLLTRVFASGEEDQAWRHIQDTGTLHVGLDASYPPFEYLDERNQIVGFDVDLANELGRRLGVEIQFVNIAYDGLYDALLIGQVDMLISALVASPEYAGRAAYSIPYFNAGEYVVIPITSSIAAMEDLSGRVLAVEYGSGGDVEARKWERRLSELTIVRYQDPSSTLAAVTSGEADAALVDGITARLGVGEHEDLMLAGNVVETLIAAAMHPESTHLKAQVDEALTGMIEDGTVRNLINKWFGPQR